MLIAPSVALAIEAKFTEPEYESVEHWLKQGDATNREAVFEGWAELIDHAVGSRCDRHALHAIPYQLVHRTASVCQLAAPLRYVVYHVFGDSVPTYYGDALRRLRAIVGPTPRLALAVAHSTVAPSAAHRALAARWTNGERTLQADVRNALRSNPLFSFGKLTCVR
jgi:hypothetical protein